MKPYETYEVGLPLKKAIEKFWSRRKLGSKNYFPPRPIPRQLENNPNALSDLIVNLGDTLMEPGRRRYVVLDGFKDKLSKGKLLGIGYLSPREVSDKPQFIPADIWQLGKLDFTKSEVISGSLKFESVRIIKLQRNKTNSSTNDNAKLSINSSKPVGRPSSRDKIIGAYNELKAEGKIDYSKPMAHAYPIIQRRLYYKYKTEKGFQNEAIRISIRGDFQTTTRD